MGARVCMIACFLTTKVIFAFFHHNFIKMKNFVLSFCALGLLFLSSCANVYYAPDAKSRSNKHEIIAVMPPKVSIAARKKVDAAAMIEQQKTESANFQREMYSWLLKRKSQNKMRIEVLDVETTNAKLTKLGYFESNTVRLPNWHPPSAWMPCSLPTTP